MKATIRDPDTLRAVRPGDLIAYVEAHGWARTETVRGGEYWRNPEAADSDDMLLPTDTSLVDYPYRVADVLAQLERKEKRSQLLIIEDLFSRNADIVRPRILHAEDDGSISLEQGAALYQGSRNMMLAAACAVLERQPVFHARKPDLAMSYLDRARFGMPQRGSYVMTIISPVSSLEVVAGELTGSVATTEPFERKVVTLLMTALASALEASRGYARSGTWGTLTASVASGVSANLLEAVLELYSAAGERELEISVGWSPSRPPPPQVQSRIALDRQDAAAIKDAAVFLRQIAPIENVEVIGKVQRLEHRGGTSGDVTILATVAGTDRSVHVHLSGQDHAVAVKAYYEREYVSCSGRLEHEGRSWRLRNAMNFGVRQPSLLLDPQEPEGSPDEELPSESET